MKTVFSIQNVSDNVQKECISTYKNTGEQWKCIFSPYTYPFIKTPIFILDSFYDMWQMANIFGANVPSFHDCADHGPEKCSVLEIREANNWRTLFLSYLQNSPNFKNPKNGAFIISCWIHCASFYDGFWSQWKVNGVLMNKAVGDWYFERTSSNNHLDCELTTKSPYRCNSQCKPY
jgi:hypothetical protein